MFFGGAKINNFVARPFFLLLSLEVRPSIPSYLPFSPSPTLSEVFRLPFSLFSTPF